MNIFGIKKTSLSLVIYYIQPLHCGVFFVATFILAAIMSQYAYMITALSFNLLPKAKASPRYLKQNFVPKSLYSWKNTELIQRQNKKIILLCSSLHSVLLTLPFYYFILDILCFITLYQRSSHTFLEWPAKARINNFLILLWQERWLMNVCWTKASTRCLAKAILCCAIAVNIAVLQLVSHGRQHVHSIVKRSAVTGYYSYEFPINCGLTWCGSGLAISLFQKTNNQKKGKL